MGRYPHHQLKHIFSIFKISRTALYNIPDTHFYLVDDTGDYIANAINNLHKLCCVTYVTS